MFKDTPQGTTHSYNDGCGMPEHNATTKPLKCKCHCHRCTVPKDMPENCYQSQKCEHCQPQPTPDMELEHCSICNSMTNHREGKCLRCAKNTPTTEEKKCIIHCVNQFEDNSKCTTCHPNTTGEWEDKLENDLLFETIGWTETEFHDVLVYCKNFIRSNFLPRSTVREVIEGMEKEHLDNSDKTKWGDGYFRVERLTTDAWNTALTEIKNKLGL